MNKKKTQTSTVEMPPKEIFRAYDIRGKVGSQLTKEGVKLIGKALATILQLNNETKVAVGRDGRVSGLELFTALQDGLNDGGISVIDLGQVTTPMTYFAGIKLKETNSCVMITGSHNPPEYNGLKIVIAGKTIFAESITNLYKLIKDKTFFNPNNKLLSVVANSEHDIFEQYLQSVVKLNPISKKFKVVVDAGNGIAGKSTPLILKALGCEVIELYCNVDGTFPNHHPDPAKPENLADLIKKVNECEADIGFAFDGDGDRVGIVDNKGQITPADEQIMIFAEDTLSRHPKAEIIFDVKCSLRLKKWIEKFNGQPTIYKTGHSFIKNKLKQTPNAQLAGEMSGHIFFKDNWYGFDDGTYAAVRMLGILDKKSLTCHELFDKLPKGFATPEIEVQCNAEGENFKIIKTLQANLQEMKSADAEVITIDGVRINYEDSWGLIRASNTTPSLILRFEGSTLKQQTWVKSKFLAWVKRHFPDLNIEI